MPKTALDISPKTPPGADLAALEALLDDTITENWLVHLDQIDPAFASALKIEAAGRISSGATEQEMAELVLKAVLSQFSARAGEIKVAPTSEIDRLVAHFGQGMAQLKGHDSEWCDGAKIESFLRQSDEELVSALIAQFPYGRPAYDWALSFSTLTFEASLAARQKYTRHGRPTYRDKTLLQQEGLDLGATQWGLALQVATFSNAEGQSYALMRQAVDGLRVCELGLAVTDLSSRLPQDARGRIWSDLIPEMMVGNTPYVLARTTDYFFIN